MIIAASGYLPSICMARISQNEVAIGSITYGSSYDYVKSVYGAQKGGWIGHDKAGRPFAKIKY